MHAVDRHKPVGIIVYTQVECELYNTTATIATHAAFTAIGIIIDHLKIIARLIIEQHESISTYAKLAVAKMLHLFYCK